MNSASQSNAIVRRHITGYLYSSGGAVTGNIWQTIGALLFLGGCAAAPVKSICSKECQETAEHRDQSVDRCMVVDADVNSCTALLESGHVPPQKLFMVYVNRSGGYIANGQYEKAIADLREAIRLKPDFALSYYNRGLAYGMQGHWEKAIAEYDKAICLEPGFAEAYGNRGSAFSQERRYEKAIPDFNEFIRLRPNSGLAYYNRGSVKLAMGDQSGKRDIERAKELGYVESK